MKPPIPQDFTQIYDEYKQAGTLSVNKLVHHYGYKHNGAVVRWLKESNLLVKKSNDLFENSIDIIEFKNFILNTKNLTWKIVCERFKLNNHKIRMICRRQDIDISQMEKYVIPNSSEINVEKFKYIATNRGATEAARTFNLPLHHAIQFAKKHNIILERYRGTVIDLYNEKEFSEDSLKLTCNQLAKKYNVSRSVILRWGKKLNINIINPFDEWKKSYDQIMQNIETYKEEQKTKTMLQIAVDHKISATQLKKAFTFLEIDTIQHGFNQSNGEKELREFVNSLGVSCFSVKKKHNDKVYEIDCFVESANFGIEYCGEYWHSDEYLEKTYHQKKYFWCKEQDIQLMTIFEHEWISKRHIIESMIKNKLGFSSKLYARKMSITNIGSVTAKDFHEKNHISGGVYSKYNYALVDSNLQIVSVISFSKSRFGNKEKHEIIRFSSIINHTIVGGFSRLMKHAIKNLGTSVITYADLRFGSGNVYSHNGFKHISVTPPNYWYYHGKSQTFSSRVKYQKHKLLNMANYDIKKTEVDIMKDNGFSRIFDCGSHKYEYAA